MRRIVTPFRTKLSRNTAHELPTAHLKPMSQLHLLSSVAPTFSRSLAQLIDESPLARLLAVYDPTSFQSRLPPLGQFFNLSYCYALK